jgi:hypothetical protein
MYAHEQMPEEPDQAAMFARNAFVITMIGAVAFIAACFVSIS